MPACARESVCSFVAALRSTAESVVPWCRRRFERNVGPSPAMWVRERERRCGRWLSSAFWSLRAARGARGVKMVAFSEERWRVVREEGSRGKVERAKRVRVRDVSEVKGVKSCSSRRLGWRRQWESERSRRFGARAKSAS